ncbi:hypothetical protein [Streptococcus moroccensis]|uniref:Uncharacterized protein n=1 Tax=Streptococcus moroccensis TaxID=1451356 RepID=A0ABT9YUI1_9STRE|nr:hypothetical protein [Streptococcus moroccensis]MDQ0223252.1 hypothetical protein [Streptococcus moroccensis]
MKKHMTPIIIAFVLLYAACILFGHPLANLPATALQYLAWSLPASLIIGLIYPHLNSQKGPCHDKA